MILKWINGSDKPPRQKEDLGYIEQSEFDATVGHEYRCHAISVLGGRASALICDDTSLPYWYPLELFAVSDGTVPRLWELGLHNIGDGVFQMIIGYPEMARNPEHYDALIDREREAMRIFYQQSGIEDLNNMELDAGIVDISPSGCYLELGNGDAGFIENIRNQQWVDGADSSKVGDTLRVVVVDAVKYPVRVSSLALDIDSARRDVTE
ncbi:S1 domain-containing protein [Nocardia terpenica]|uniref:hypothetical protein n=1 Tax=Nocardia terpenica TaxID=455432 RepID=UPI0012FD2803|nr:hypothetical protein [Nocardia terpenica]